MKVVGGGGEEGCIPGWVILISCEICKRKKYFQEEEGFVGGSNLNLLQNDVGTVGKGTLLASEQRNLLISDFKSFPMGLKPSRGESQAFKTYKMQNSKTCFTNSKIISKSLKHNIDSGQENAMCRGGMFILLETFGNNRNVTRWG